MVKRQKRIPLWFLTVAVSPFLFLYLASSISFFFLLHCNLSIVIYFTLSLTPSFFWMFVSFSNVFWCYMVIGGNQLSIRIPFFVELANCERFACKDSALEYLERKGKKGINFQWLTLLGITKKSRQPMLRRRSTGIWQPTLRPPRSPWSTTLASPSIGPLKNKPFSKKDSLCMITIFLFFPFLWVDCCFVVSAFTFFIFYFIFKAFCSVGGFEHGFWKFKVCLY